MAKALTQAEIDAMFDAGATVSASQDPPEEVQEYSFTAHRTLSADQSQEISDLSERFARSLASRLSGWLKTDVTVKIVAVERAPYGEILESIPDGGTYFSSVQFEAVSAIAVLHLEMQLGYCILDLLLGGAGKTSLNTDLTHVDEQLFQAVMSFVCEELSTSWRGIGLAAKLRDRLMFSQINRLMPFDEQVLCLTFEMQVGDTQGNLVLTLPAAVSSFLLRQLAGTWKGRREHPPAVRDRLVYLSKKIACQLSLQLPSAHVPYGSIQQLAPGQVLELNIRETISPRLLLSGAGLFEATAVSHGSTRAALLKQRVPKD